MPRTSRTIAQRLGTKQKSRRRPLRPSPEMPANVERILDDATPLSADEVGNNEEFVPAVKPARLAARRGAVAGPRSVARQAPPRRRYSEYAADYAYIGLDLRRIAVVTGILVALLIALSFVIY